MSSIAFFTWGPSMRSAAEDLGAEQVGEAGSRATALRPVERAGNGATQLALRPVQQTGNGAHVTTQRAGGFGYELHLWNGHLSAAEDHINVLHCLFYLGSQYEVCCGRLGG